MQTQKKVHPIQKKKKWQKKYILGISIFVFVFCVPIGIKIGEMVQHTNSQISEYTGECFFRSIQEGTGRNKIHRFEMILNNTQSNILPAFEIDQKTYQMLGGFVSEKNVFGVCTRTISVKYSLQNHFLVSLEIL